MTPGIDTMLVLRHTLLADRRAGFATVAGITLGYLAWATASLAGLTALLAASQTAYDVVRVAGASYLIWLGGIAIWKSLPRNREAATGFYDVAPAAHLKMSKALRSGLVTNMLNPKVGVFYISILPQFLPAESGATTWGVLLVAIHVAVTALWFSVVIWMAAKARRLLLRERVRAWLDRVTAAVLIGVGFKLASEVG
ncbi:LysE family translocator [Streptomyces sp. NPDC102381]|uniref:LysE family translocator n=1 Tax=Streptomyces sp. NPDC102381 TaxID=3366164 RepID=UPI003817D5EB